MIISLAQLEGWDNSMTWLSSCSIINGKCNSQGINS